MDSFFLIRAMPNEYLVNVGEKEIKPLLGGSAFKLFRRFIKIPAYTTTTEFELECSSRNFFGVRIKGYIVWRLDPHKIRTAINCLNFRYSENKEDSESQNIMMQTSYMLSDMAKDAVRQVVAEVNIEDILTTREKMNQNILEKLQIVSQWGLIVDTTGIDSIYIISESVYGDLQAHDRYVLRTHAKRSEQESALKVEQYDFEVKKEQAEMQSQLREHEVKEEIKINNLNNELELEKIRAEEDRKNQELIIKKSVEKERYEYHQAKLNNDQKLQNTRMKIDFENLKYLEEKKKVDNYVGERKMLDDILLNIGKLSSIYQKSNIHIFSGDDSNSLLKPLAEIINLIKQSVSIK